MIPKLTKVIDPVKLRDHGKRYARVIWKFTILLIVFSIFMYFVGKWAVAAYPILDHVIDIVFDCVGDAIVDHNLGL